MSENSVSNHNTRVQKSHDYYIKRKELDDKSDNHTIDLGNEPAFKINYKLHQPHKPTKSINRRLSVISTNDIPKAILSSKNKIDILDKKTGNIIGTIHDNEPYGGEYIGDDEPIPTSWDWREITSTLNDELLIGNVRNQGNCGSCYAFASTSALADRLSIATDGVKKLLLSPQDIINCGEIVIKNCFDNSSNRDAINQLIEDGIIEDADWYILDGCGGGLLNSVNNYLVLAGVTSEKDVPYLHGSSEESGNESISNASNYCTELRTNLEKYYAKFSRQLTWHEENGFPAETVQLDPEILEFNVRNMELSIVNFGPIISGFSVWTDFFYYPRIELIYRRKSTFVVNGQTIVNRYEGAHAISIVGFGETIDSEGELVKYWICRNSWSTDFGINGYFYIEKGVNMVNIEFDAASNQPDLSKCPTLGIIIFTPVFFHNGKNR